MSSWRGGQQSVRILLISASWLCVLLLPVAIASAVVTNLFFDASYYHAGEVKYEVMVTTGMSISQLDRVNAGIIRFFSSSESLPAALKDSGANPDVFKQKEILHMDDVRTLLQAIGKIEIVSLVAIFGFVSASLLTARYGGRAALSRGLQFGSIFTVLLVILTGVGAYTSFDQIFITFHEMAFRNNYWELDPRTDHLIQMFPLGFWYDALLTVALRVVVVAALLWLCGMMLGRLDRRRA